MMRRSEAMALDFEAILGRLTQAVLVHDAATRILYANGSASQLLGVPLAELLQADSFHPPWDCVDEIGRALTPEQQPNVIAMRTKAAVQGVTIGVKRGDRDQRVWLEFTAEPSYGSTGEVEYVVVTFREVGSEGQARREAERARDASELLYRSVLRAMSEGVVVHAADGSIDFANPAAERALGLSVEQMAGRAAVDPRWQLVDERDQPLPPERIPSEVTRATGKPCDQVALGVHRSNGERAWLSVSTDPVAIDPATNRPSAVVATFTDVTRETLIKHELAASRARFQLVMDAFPGLLYEFRGKQGKYRFGFLSGRAEEFFGSLARTALEDAGPILAAVHPDEREALMRSVLESEQALTPWHFEGRIPRPEGGWRWARAQSVPTREGDEVVWHGVVTDVTEQRRIADTLRHRQKVEAMGELVAGVAHNFNNMLAVIMPNLDMALDDVRGETRVILNEARHATHSAAELVRQLMRITRREPDAAPELVDMLAIVRDVGALLTRTLGGSIALELDLPSRPLHVRGIASDLNMVLLNLCFNARDALKDRAAPYLKLRLRTQPAGAGHELVLEVEDNGAGMNEATLQRLGEPFFTTKGPGAGTGLGIASAFALIRSLGGRVDVESSLGVGTTFRVRLPLADGPGEYHRQEALPLRRLDGVEVLLVEDEAFVREALTRMLVSMGARVHAEPDGPAGIAAFGRRRFDVVLLDLNLPGMTGVAVLEELHDIAPEQRVIVLTGHASGEEGLSAASAVAIKPITRQGLVEVITRVLGTGEQRAPLGSRGGSA